MIDIEKDYINKGKKFVLLERLNPFYPKPSYCFWNIFRIINYSDVNFKKEEFDKYVRIRNSTDEIFWESFQFYARDHDNSVRLEGILYSTHLSTIFEFINDDYEILCEYNFGLNISRSYDIGLFIIKKAGSGHWEFEGNQCDCGSCKLKRENEYLDKCCKTCGCDCQS